MSLTWQAYNSCDADKKKSLIVKYKTEGGIKNLVWVTSYVEKSKDQEITDTHVKKRYFYGSEILSMNGFQSNQLDQKTKAKVLEGLLEDYYNTFEIDPANPPLELKQENKKVPQLTKYWYQKASLSSTDKKTSWQEVWR